MGGATPLHTWDEYFVSLEHKGRGSYLDQGGEKIQRIPSGLTEKKARLKAKKNAPGKKYEDDGSMSLAGLQQPSVRRDAAIALDAGGQGVFW